MQVSAYQVRYHIIGVGLTEEMADAESLNLNLRPSCSSTGGVEVITFSQNKNEACIYHYCCIHDHGFFVRRSNPYHILVYTTMDLRPWIQPISCVMCR